MQVLQRWIFDLVNTLNLTHQQLRITDQLEGLGTMLEGIFEGRDQSLILGEVVGLMAEILTEGGYFAARFVLNDHAITGGSGIPTSTAVTVRDQVFCRRILAFIEQTCGIAGGIRGHV